MIWAKPNEPLTQDMWEANGFSSLQEYVESLLSENERAMKTSKPERRTEIDGMPVCTFGTLDPETGDKEILLTCETLEDLPTEDIEGVLAFNIEEDAE